MSIPKKYKRAKFVDLNTYEPKTNGKNRALFIETKRVEMEAYRLLDKYGVPEEEQQELIHNFAKLRDVINHSEVTRVNGTRKKNKYRVVIAVNGTRKKHVDYWLNLEPATDRFNELREEASTVHIPKKNIIHDRAMVPVEYEVYLLKSYEPGDARRYRRDKMGKIYQEDYFDGNWVIIDSAPYAYEETFGVFGYASNDKLDVTRLITEVLPKHTDKYPTKQMYVVNHRVLVEYGNKLDIIVASTPDQAMRLYAKLSEVIVNAGMNNIFCAGKITNQKLITEKYDIIERVTGWDRRRVNRTTTVR